MGVGGKERVEGGSGREREAGSRVGVGEKERVEGGSGRERGRE